MNKEGLKEEALKWRNKFNKGQKNWSAVHYTTVFGSIILSVFAGAVLQFKSGEAMAIATVLTSLAAALSSLAAAGGFERKWRSNRLSRSRIDGLLMDIEGDSPNLPELTKQLKDIIMKHDLEIVGEKSDEDEEPKPNKDD
jgi:hypothetical protein